MITFQRLAVFTLTLLPALYAQSAYDQKLAAEALHLQIAGVAGAGRLIQKKPYSAESITETVQLLADGNRIVRHNATKFYRDRFGRTRREQMIEAMTPSSPVTGAVGSIVIWNPVASFDYILDPSSQTARKFTHFDDTAVQNDSEPHSPEGAPLGTRTIEGLSCVGMRKTTTIPAGQIGNLRPIVSVNETWYSTAIEALVRSVTSDPRFGETTYTLRNIHLADPPPELFEPPPGYQVHLESAPAGAMKRVH